MPCCENIGKPFLGRISSYDISTRELHKKEDLYFKLSSVELSQFTKMHLKALQTWNHMIRKENKQNRVSSLVSTTKA